MKGAFADDKWKSEYAQMPRRDVTFTFCERRFSPSEWSHGGLRSAAVTIIYLSSILRRGGQNVYRQRRETSTAERRRGQKICGAFVRGHTEPNETVSTRLCGKLNGPWRQDRFNLWQGDAGSLQTCQCCLDEGGHQQKICRCKDTDLIIIKRRRTRNQEWFCNKMIYPLKSELEL